MPKVLSALPIVKWLDTKIGICFIPLRHVVRETAAAPAPPALAVGLPHLTEHSSVEGEHCMLTHCCFIKTIKKCLIALKKHCVVHTVQLLSSHFSGQRMVGERVQLCKE